MNKREALKAMLEGKKVCKTYWRKDYYVFLDEYSNEIMMSQSDANISYDLNSETNEHWCIYKEASWNHYCTDWETSDRIIKQHWGDVSLVMFNPDEQRIKINVEVEE